MLGSLISKCYFSHSSGQLNINNPAPKDLVQIRKYLRPKEPLRRTNTHKIIKFLFLR